MNVCGLYRINSCGLHRITTNHWVKEFQVKAKPGKNKDVDEDDEGVDEADWMSISSDEGSKTKVIHVHEAKGNSSSSKKKKKVEKMSAEETKAMRAENGKTSKLCKKVQGLLEPVLKQCNKAAKASHTAEDFKNEINAAKDIIKECKKIIEKQKGKATETLIFQYSEDVAKELKKSLEKNLKCHETVGALKNGGMDADEIAALVSAATARQAKDGKAVNVD